MFKQFMCELADRENEIKEASLSKDSEEVARFVAGYAARNILRKTKCEECCSKMISERENEAHGYLEVLSRGGTDSTFYSFIIRNCKMLRSSTLHHRKASFVLGMSILQTIIGEIRTSNSMIM